MTPDTKSWTWVLERRCDDCGLDASTVGRAEVGPRLREAGAVLAAAAVDTARPAPDVWSPLEYACHVRDVYRLFGERLTLMLTQDDPEFANWDQDATAVQSRYDEQDPAVVAVELLQAGSELADRFDALPADVWDRMGRRSDGARFTVTTFAQYLVHDPVHHAWDVTAPRA